MQFILDHISAILISTAVVLLVLSTQFNAQRAGVEQTIAYASKKQTLEMADYIEDELLLIGDGTTDLIVSVETNDEGETTLFSFWRDDDDGTDMLVSYTLTETSTVEIDDETIQMYRMDRFEDGVASGGGSSTIEHFRITMLDENGSVTGSTTDARLLRVAIINVYPYGDSDDTYMFRNYWGITLRPMNLG